MTTKPSESTGASATGNRSGLTTQWGGKIAFYLTYTHLSHDISTGLLAALLPFIRDELGLNYLQAGFLISAFAITYGVSQLLGGWISDRINRRKAIMLGLGGVGLSSVAIGLAPSFNMILLGLIAMGILGGFYHPSAVSALATHFDRHQRGKVIALHMVGGSIGFGIGPLLGAIIASQLNWHMAYILLSLPALLAVPLVFTQLKQPSFLITVKRSAPTTTPGKKSVKQVFRSAAGIMIISVAMQLFTGPVQSFTPLFLVDVHHLTAAAGSTWLTMIRLGGLAGSVLGGWLADRWGRKQAIFLALSLLGPVILLFANLPFGFALAGVLIIFGLLMAMRETTMQTYLMDKTPPELRATVFGIYFGFGHEGSSIIQPIAGNFMDLAGIAAVYNYLSLITISLSALTLFLAYRSFRQVKASRNLTIG